MKKNIKKVYILNKSVGAVIAGIIIFILITINLNYNKIELEINTDNSIFYELGTDLISQYQTTYNEENVNRSTNIKLATEKVNETIVLPNEIFSYNKVVGRRGEQEGFKLATVYQNGKVVKGFGGGVCQVSSTLYNAVLYANLEVIERKNHLFLPSYSNVGEDATVSDGYIDFKFKNTRKYPIKIICSASNGILNVKIYGKKQEDECIIEIQSEVVEEIPYKTIYENNVNLIPGEYKLIQSRKKRI